jgi:cobaltochelatase CobS
MQLVGGFGMKGYNAGQLEQAWKNGGVLILDEMPKLDPNTAGLLNQALSDAAKDYAIFTNGAGDKIVKHPDFCCIGTGNTDMKSVGANFSGNNRQDYSLVDRFSGSFYRIEENVALEMMLTYPIVYSIGAGLRAFLITDPNSVEAITLRSMLNFNRTYELEMLRVMGSPLMLPAAGATIEETQAGMVQGKTLYDSVISFVETLGIDRARELRDKKYMKIVSLAPEVL